MPLIEVNKAVQDCNALRLKLLDFLSKESDTLIIKISALSGLYAQIFSEHYIEFVKCLDMLIDKVFSAVKSDIIRCVNMVNSDDVA